MAEAAFAAAVLALCVALVAAVGLYFTRRDLARIQRDHEAALDLREQLASRPMDTRFDVL